MLDRASGGEDENMRAVRVGERDAEASVLNDESDEWIEMWTIGHKQSIACERRFKQSDYKPIVVSRACKDRDALHGRRKFTFEIAHDSHKVFVKTFLFVRLVLV